MTAREDDNRLTDEISTSRALFRVGGLFRSDCKSCLAAKAAANGDALRINGHTELPAESPTAIVGQRPDQLAA